MAKGKHSKSSRIKKGKKGYIPSHSRSSSSDDLRPSVTDIEAPETKPDAPGTADDSFLDSLAMEVEGGQAPDATVALSGDELAAAARSNVPDYVDIPEDEPVAPSHADTSSYLDTLSYGNVPSYGDAGFHDDHPRENGFPMRAASDDDATTLLDSLSGAYDEPMVPPMAPMGMQAITPDVEKKHHMGTVVRNVLLALLGILVLVYAAGVVFFMSHFEPNAKVSGADVSYQNIDRAEQTISDHVSTYKLTLVERPAISESAVAVETQAAANATGAPSEEATDDDAAAGDSGSAGSTDGSDGSSGGTGAANGTGTDSDGTSTGAGTASHDEASLSLSLVQPAYAVPIASTTGSKETISGSDFNLAYNPDGTLEKLLESQNKFDWPLRLAGLSTSDQSINVSFDQDKLIALVATLKCMNPDLMVAPADATLVFDGSSYIVQPEIMGTTVEPDKVNEQVTAAVSKTEDDLDLQDAGCYKDPEIYSDSPALVTRADLLNKYVPFSITYTFDDGNEVLDGNTAIEWYTINPDGTATLDEDKLEEWVEGLAERHDTVGKTRQFTGVDGNTYTVSGGTYGWKIDQDAEIEAIEDQLTSHTSEIREPYYSSTAVSHNDPEWGDTFIEVSIGDQHFWVVEDGQVILESDCVTGLPTAKRATPTGVFSILDKQSPYTMHGEQHSDGSYEYVTTCSYWMRVTWSGVGFHDAPWQPYFGGSRYQSGGSHGCINTPPSTAAEMYGLIQDGWAVIIHD